MRSLARNSFSIVATGAVNAALGYGYWTLAAKAMPTREMGLGSAATSALVIIALAVHLGIGGGLIARLPQRGTTRRWRLTVVSAVLVATAVTVIAAAAAVVPLGMLVAPLHPLTRRPDFAAWFVVGAGGWTASGLLDYVFIAERRSDLMLVRNAVTAVTKLGGLALVATALVPGGGAEGIVATWAVSALVGAAVGLYLCHRCLHRLGPVRVREMPGELGTLIRPSLGHHAISVGGLLPTYLLPIVVTARLGAAENAYFYTTWMVGSAIFMISPAVSSALFAEGSHEDGRLHEMSWRSTVTTLAVIAVPSAALCLVGRPVLGLFGPGYRAGYPLLVLLVASAFPDTVSNVAVATLRVRGLLRRAATLNVSMALISVAGAWYLTPRMGILGAGLCWLGSQVAGALAVLALRRLLLPAPDRTGSPNPASGRSPKGRHAHRPVHRLLPTHHRRSGTSCGDAVEGVRAARPRGHRRDP